MRIDAHQHFWTLERGDYDWPNDSVRPIFRNFDPNDLRPHLKHAGIEKTILVQATDTTAETEFLLNLAEKTDFVAGVVGWVDLTAPDAIPTIDRLRSNVHLLGLRPMLQNIAETGWILRDDVQPALAHLQKTGLCFDALIQPRHLAAVATLARAYPDLRIVIDHIAKPIMGNARRPEQDWLGGMATLASLNNVSCKLSGMMTEIGPSWSKADLLPYTETVLELFGPKRLMFGSDWPVLNLASTYADWLSFVTEFLVPLTPSEKRDIMGETARRFYQLHQN